MLFNYLISVFVVSAADCVSSLTLHIKSEGCI